MKKILKPFALVLLVLAVTQGLSFLIYYIIELGPKAVAWCETLPVHQRAALVGAAASVIVLTVVAIASFLNYLTDKYA